MKYYLILLSFLISLNSVAQTVTGKVTDANDNPIEYANVILLNTDSTYIQGATTDREGEFQFDNMSGYGDCLLKISFVGYKTSYKSCIAGNIGIIKMQPDSQTLSEVVVTGNATIYKMKGNSLITTVHNTVLSHLSNATKVIDYIPGVQNDGNGLSVFGKGKPLIYLNGRILNDLTELDRLKADNIATIELIKNPGSEYSASSRAILKIKTIRKAGDGLSFDVTSFYQLAHKSSWQEVLQANYRRDKLDIFATFNYINYAGFQDNKSQYQIFSSTPLFINRNIKINNTTESYFGKAGFDYYFTPKQSIGAYYSHNYQTIEGHGNENAIVSENANADQTDNQSYQSLFDRTAPTNRINAYYSGHIGPININYSNELYFQSSKENQFINESTEMNGKREITTRNKLSNRVLASSLLLQYIKKGHRMSLGVEYNYTRRTNEYKNEEGIIEDTKQKIEQDKWAAFFNYMLALKKLEVEAGIRYEHYQFDYYKNLILIDEQSRIYNDLYPSISISYPFGKLEMNVSYSVKTRKPTYASLDGHVQYESRNVYTSGNALLRPMTIHDLQLSAFYKGLSFSMDYIRKKNAIIRGYRFYDKEQSIILSSYDNYPNADIFQAEISYSKKVGIWKPQLTIDMTMSNYEFKQENSGIKMNDPYVSISFNNSFQFKQGWYIYLLGRYNSKGCDEDFRLTDKGRISLNIIKSWKNFDFDLLFNDIFRTNKNIFTTYSPACTFWSSNYSDTRNIQLTLRYRINGSRSKYRGKSAAGDELIRM